MNNLKKIKNYSFHSIEKHNDLTNYEKINRIQNIKKFPLF